MNLAVLKSDLRMEEVANILSNYYEVVFIETYEELKSINNIEAIVPTNNLLDIKYLIIGFKNFNKDGKLCINNKLVDLKLVNLDNIIIIAPVPNKFLESLNNIKYYFFLDKKVIVDNAELTSEGIIYYLIENTNTSIKDLKIDIIGYGNCGRSIHRWLEDLNIEHRIIRRSTSNNDDRFISIYDWKKQGSNNIIINTADYEIIDHQIIENLNKALIIDIATRSNIDTKYALLKNHKV
ncbi:MAG: hypothetical protein RSD85_02870, partial [Erysipelotrichaceae bacterium]